MTKTIARFLIILLAACLVAGGLYWLVQANPSLLAWQDSSRGEGGERLRGQGLKGLPVDEDDGEARPEQDFEGGGGEHNNQRIGTLDDRSIASILRNVLIIVLTTLAVLAIQKGWSLIKRRRQAKAAQTPDV